MFIKRLMILEFTCFRQRRVEKRFLMRKERETVFQFFVWWRFWFWFFSSFFSLPARHLHWISWFHSSFLTTELLILALHCYPNNQPTSLNSRCPSLAPSRIFLRTDLSPAILHLQQDSTALSLPVMLMDRLTLRKILKMTGDPWNLLEEETIKWLKKCTMLLARK